MYDDLFKKTNIDSDEEEMEVLERAINYDPRFRIIIEKLLDKNIDLEKNIDTTDELLIEARDEIKRLRKLLKENDIEYEETE
jgi:hypothetical protein